MSARNPRRKRVMRKRVGRKRRGRSNTLRIGWVVDNFDHNFKKEKFVKEHKRAQKNQ